MLTIVRRQERRPSRHTVRDVHLHVMLATLMLMLTFDAASIHGGGGMQQSADICSLLQMQSASYDDVIHSLKHARNVLDTRTGNCGQKRLPEQY